MGVPMSFTMPNLSVPPMRGLPAGGASVAGVEAGCASAAANKKSAAATNGARIILCQVRSLIVLRPPYCLLVHSDQHSDANATPANRYIHCKMDARQSLRLSPSRSGGKLAPQRDECQGCVLG